MISVGFCGELTETGKWGFFLIYKNFSDAHSKAVQTKSLLPNPP